MKTFKVTIKPAVKLADGMLRHEAVIKDEEDHSLKLVISPVFGSKDHDGRLKAMQLMVESYKMLCQQKAFTEAVETPFCPERPPCTHGWVRRGHKTLGEVFIACTNPACREYAHDMIGFDEYKISVRRYDEEPKQQQTHKHNGDT